MSHVRHEWQVLGQAVGGALTRSEHPLGSSMPYSGHLKRPQLEGSRAEEFTEACPAPIAALSVVPGSDFTRVLQLTCRIHACFSRAFDLFGRVSVPDPSIRPEPVMG